MTEEKPRLPPIVGKPLWYQGKGDPKPQLGFLIGRTFDTVRGCELGIGLLASNDKLVVGESTCWLAGYDEAKGDWSGIICTYPNWGVGIIQGSVWDEKENEMYLKIQSLLQGEPKGELKYLYLSKVTLDDYR